MVLSTPDGAWRKVFAVSDRALSTHQSSVWFHEEALRDHARELEAALQSRGARPTPERWC